MADKDIEIGMRTTADTKGAEEVTTALDKTQESVKKVEMQTDDLKGANDEAAPSQKKLADEMGALKDKAGPAAESLKRLEQQTKTIALLGKAEFLGKVAEGLNKATTEGGAFAKELAPLKGLIEGVSTSVSGLSVGLSTFATTGNPFAAIAAGVEVMSGDVIRAYGDMSKAQKNAETAEKAAGVSQLDLLKTIEFRKKNIVAITQSENIAKENLALDTQIAKLERLVGLRSELSAGEVSAAEDEVTFAKLNGGDVALAEANAIAVRLAADIQALKDNLLLAKTQAAKAAKTEADAKRDLKLIQDEVKEGIRKADDEAIQLTKDAITTAERANTVASETLAGAEAKFKQGVEGAVRKTEIAIAEADKEFEGKISPIAKARLDEVFNTLPNILSTATAPVIQQIQVEAGIIQDAATAKATEVKAAVETERAGTVQAVQTLAPTPQDTQAIVNAVQAVSTAQTTQGNAIITALTNTANTIGALTQRVQVQDQKIAQIFSRLR
jgi:hypothetical protein